MLISYFYSGHSCWSTIHGQIAVLKIHCFLNACVYKKFRFITIICNKALHTMQNVLAVRTRPGTDQMGERSMLFSICCAKIWTIP